MLVRFDPHERLYKTLRLVRSIHLNMQRASERMLDGAGISVAERAILELFCLEALTVPEAARRLSMKRQFVLRVVNGLMDKHLLEKQPNPEHQRAYLCTPTVAGRDLFEEIRRREVGMLHALLGDINQTEVVATLRVMTRVATAFEQLAGELDAAVEGEAL
ncbi:MULTISPECIES: MarR family transcriptional regulator [unclassified Ensifer]|uniref:MarR family winged helix-turn-helix transcriptional regulator n=1 Tax=unclassified Ensifer TaxID=2633371 RepID=UPI000812D5A3|nr:MULTISPECIES: MarR family transcriptional regulator [unclassified Ensifer]OCO99720.1 MarR family transcriptional regulator [Ensifer sp. LC14]OCP04645.1 MarR family transcriptional regulator [Ensifer sp. LC11]OCP12499.1 MarR family transcriptional regulator [Ensifer sp. LC13]OCP32979.1 MarR family transcriptional regulator [Ensifer sp. LC499]